MRIIQKPLSLYVALFTPMLVAFPPIVGATLSDSQADSIVAEEAAAKSEQKAERKRKILEVPASRETTFRDGDRTVVVRRTAPPPLIDPDDVESDETTAEKEAGESPVPVIDDKPVKTLTLVARIADDLSEIRSLGTESESDYVVVSDITTLPPTVTIETSEVRYVFFFLVSPVNEITPAPTKGVSVKSPGNFTIYSDGPAISESFEAAIAALYEHHREYQADWEADAQRAKALQAARNRFQEENPPASPETTINVWRIDRDSADGK